MAKIENPEAVSSRALLYELRISDKIIKKAVAYFSPLYIQELLDLSDEDKKLALAVAECEIVQIRSEVETDVKYCEAKAIVSDFNSSMKETMAPYSAKSKLISAILNTKKGK